MGFFSSIFGGGDGGAGEAAAYARAMERRRQRRIGWAMDEIAKNFAGFDDSYYGGLERDALDFYRPQVEDQAEDARRQLIFSLARTGGLDSSSGERRLADLQETTTNAYSGVADKARSYAMGVRGDVESNRAELENQARIAADPSSSARSATNRAFLLSTPPAYSPLGDLFAGITGTFANQAALEAQGYRGTGTGLFRTGTRPDASRVIGG